MCIEQQFLYFVFLTPLSHAGMEVVILLVLFKRFWIADVDGFFIR